MLTAVTDVTPRSTLRDASNGDHVVSRTRFLLPPSEHGTGCQQNSSWCVSH